jgi:predicted O-methyltransferase YrrM
VVLKHRKADMVFIDGSHDFCDVARDIQLATPLLAPGGLLCGHDRFRPGVHSAIDELVSDWKEGPGSLWHSTRSAV